MHRTFSAAGFSRLILLFLAVTLAPEPLSADKPADVVVERLGEPTIEVANDYSENTRVRVRLVYPPDHVRAGRPWPGSAQVRIEEWNTQVYDGLHGATRLPLRIVVHGEAVVVLKSLARYAHVDMRSMPIPHIAVSAGGPPQLLQVPQWVDADGNDKIDWLERRVDDLLRHARASDEPEVARAARALRGWEQSPRRDCGGFDERRPHVISIAPACLDFDGLDSHRLNRGRELTATLLHELWHVSSHARSMTASGTRRWLKRPAHEVEPIPCPHGCAGPVWLADARYAAEEDDAEAFAERYKHLLP